jgi:hypothetical protein
MATWGEHPEKVRGHLFLYRPEPLKTMLVNGTPTYPIDYLSFDNEAGATTWLHKNRHLTVSFGTAAYGWNKGVCPVQYIDEAANRLYLPYKTPNGLRPGEINAANNNFITIWKDWRPWYLSTQIHSDAGYPEVIEGRKGNLYTSLYWYHQLNIGSGGVFAQAGEDGYWQGTFSANDSCSPQHASFIYTIAQQTLADANLSVSSTYSTNVKGNLVDGSDATWWESSTGTDEWIKIDAGAGNTFDLCQFMIKIHTTYWGPAQMTVEWSNDDATYTTISWHKPSNGMVPISEYWFVLDDPPQARYWKINLIATMGGTRFQIEELEVYKRTTLSMTWDVDNGTLAGGYAATDTTIEALFPVGISWIKAYHGTGTPDLSTTLARRPVVVLDAQKWIPTLYDCSITGTGNYPERAYDGLLETTWGGNPCYADLEFPTYRVFKRVRVNVYGNVLEPILLQFSVKDEVTGSFTLFHEENALAWTPNEYEWKEFTFDAPVWGKTFRVYQEGSVASPSTGIQLIEWVYEYPWGVSLNQFEVQSHDSTALGQEMTFRVYEDISNYPPGTLVMYREDEYFAGVKGSLAAADPTGQDREGLVFTGWVDQLKSKVERKEDGTIAYTDLVCYDLGGWAKRLPSIPPVFKRYEEAQPYNPDRTTWGYGIATGLCIDHALHSIFCNHATLSELGDYYPSETYQNYRVPALEPGKGGIMGVMDGLAQKIARRATCNKMGQIKIVKDQNLFSSGDRSITDQGSIGPADITKLSYVRTYTSRVGRHWGSAIQVSEEHWEDITGGMQSFFCLSPDVDYWGQGLSQIEFGEQLVIDQAELNTREGQRYAVRSNAEFSYIDVELAHGNDAGFDPAHPDPILLTIDDTNKAPDGYTCTDERWYIIKLRYIRDAQKMTKRCVLTLEREVDGINAHTFTPPS